MAKVKVFICNHSGLLLPADYVSMWGILYGHGLGREPVSECLDTDDRKLPDNSRANYSEGTDGYMYPMSDSHASITLAEVEEEEWADESRRLIIARDDPNFVKRRKILREKQKKKTSTWNRLKAHLGATD